MRCVLWREKTDGQEKGKKKATDGRHDGKNPDVFNGPPVWVVFVVARRRWRSMTLMTMMSQFYKFFLMMMMQRLILKQSNRKPPSPLQQLLHQLPVTILTGFLGSGKSTLIKHVLNSSTHGRKIAVIENEFGGGGSNSSSGVNYESDAAINVESVIVRDGTTIMTDDDNYFVTEETESLSTKN